MSKYQSYEDCRAVCPYYNGAHGRELLCDGLYRENYAVLMRFRRIEALRAHRERYCDNIREYCKCRLYRAHF